MKVSLREYRLSDAKQLFTILSNPKFRYFGSSVGSVEEERAWLIAAKKRRTEQSYGILADGVLVGGCGIT